MASTVLQPLPKARSTNPWIVTIRSILPLVIGIGLAVGFHAFVRPPTIEPFYTKVMMDIGINIILAVSLTMVNGFTGQFSMGHAGFMAVGGYMAAAITYYGSFLLWDSGAFHGGYLSWALPREFTGAWIGAGDILFLVACLAGGLVAAALGYVVGLPSLRLRGDYLAIVTLGFGEIVRVLLTQTGDVLSTTEEVHAVPKVMLLTKLGGALGFSSAIGVPNYTTLFWIYAFVALTLLVAFRLKFSTFGRAFLSIREDEIAAEAMGIHTTRYKVRAFVIAAFFAGIAGSLFAHQLGTTLNPQELGFQKSIDVIIMVVLGGMGSISGAALAAIILTILPESLRQFAEYRMIVYALLLILMMILRPQGLFGIHEAWDYVMFWRRRSGVGR